MNHDAGNNRHPSDKQYGILAKIYYYNLKEMLNKDVIREQNADPDMDSLRGRSEASLEV